MCCTPTVRLLIVLTLPPRYRLYEAPRVKRAFRDQHFFFFPSVSRCSRERNSALMARQSPCLAELSGQPPEPGGSRPPWAGGVDGKSASKATMAPGHYANKCNCVLRCC